MRTNHRLLATHVRHVRAKHFQQQLGSPNIQINFRRTRRPTRAVANRCQIDVRRRRMTMLTTPTATRIVSVATFALRTTATTTVRGLAFTASFDSGLRPNFLLYSTSVQIVAIAGGMSVGIFNVPNNFC